MQDNPDKETVAGPVGAVPVKVNVTVPELPAAIDPLATTSSGFVIPVGYEIPDNAKPVMVWLLVLLTVTVAVLLIAPPDETGTSPKTITCPDTV